MAYFINAYFQKVIISQFLFLEASKNLQKAAIERDYDALKNGADSHLMHMHTESFVYYLNMLSVLLRTFSNYLEDVASKERIERILKFFNDNYSSLKDIRDTIQHIEARILGKDRKGKKMNIAALSIGNFNVSKYQTTSSKGEHVEIEVLDMNNMIELHKILNELFKSLTGSPIHF